MSLFGVPAKCPRCNKTVYAAEQKLAEGQSWHNLCWSLEFKERETNKKSKKDEVSYTKPADVSPAYYRVADVDSGVPARMETKPEELGAPEEGAGGSFCSQCGRAKIASDRFCAGCGNKLF